MNAQNSKPLNIPHGVPPDEGIYIGNLYTTPRTIAQWRADSDECKRLLAEKAALRAELLHLEQAYTNRHSPQHRQAALNSARAALEATK